MWLRRCAGRASAKYAWECRDRADADDEYASLDTADLQALALERGLPVRCGERKEVLLPLLRGYDIGQRAGSFLHALSDERDEVEVGLGSKQTTPVSSMRSVLQKIRDSPGHMGCDIGESFAKMVIAYQEGQSEEDMFPEKFGSSGRCHRHLQMRLSILDESFLLTFLSGSTADFEAAAAQLERTSREGCLGLAQLRAPAAPVSPSRQSDEKLAGSGTAYCRMATSKAAGNFAPHFCEVLQVDLEPLHEMRPLLDGFFLLAQGSHSREGSLMDQEIFTIGEDGGVISRSWPEPLFPLILVVMGSGVSILRVNSFNPGDYARMGGTGCGGGTFLALARRLTSANTLEEALEMAAAGNASNLDTLVSDIDGTEGSLMPSLHGDITACNFGKLSKANSSQNCSEKDVARSLLQMVTEQSVLLAFSHARMAGCMNRVFFVGSFLDQKNAITRQAIGLTAQNLGGGSAYFMRHSEFLGALGSLGGHVAEGGGLLGQAHDLLAHQGASWTVTNMIPSRVTGMFNSHSAEDMLIKQRALTTHELHMQMSFKQAKAEDSRCHIKFCRILFNIVENPLFDMFFALVVMLNAVFLGIDMQMRISDPTSQSVPLDFAQFIFGMLFTMELGVRFAVVGARQLLCSKDWPWTLLDITVVTGIIWETALDAATATKGMSETAPTSSSLTVFRILRVTRIVKVLQLTRIFRFVAALRTLVQSILHTLKALYWALLLLSLIVYVFALLFCETASRPQPPMCSTSLPYAAYD
ncbi:Pantothenate kinase 2 (AtPANK2) (Pantothenic acid kinase 2) [Includes: Pantothenate kinase [Durusdinium trenchii]|uniref:Pantothenate kinase 2 (AtPANK2) (Pantothenic acid kinase 2) n=1 Tax=Durusdinium trenchii TaxID=1381693 RepID=A0ABP0ISK2_9DINO